MATAVILAVTTFPAPTAEPGGTALCIICGQRGLADALLNVLLFAPFGAALAFAHASLQRTVLVAACLSGLIESAQLLVIVGRDGNLGDVLFNTMGAAAGFTIATRGSQWLALTARGATAFAWTWSVLVAGVTLGAGFLLAPALPRSVYIGAWTPAFEHLASYDGRVLDARVGPTAATPGPLDDPAAIRAMMLEAEPLRVRALAGSRPAELAPLIMVNDDRQREIVLLGVDRDDVVLRHRNRAQVLRLDRPDLRAPGAMLGVERGDSILLAAWRHDGAYCLQRDEHRQCGVGITSARAWSLLLYPESLPAWCMRLLDAGWLAALFAPLGFWARDATRGILTVLPAGVTLFIAPTLTELVPSAPAEMVVAMVAVFGGALAARAVGHRTRRRVAPHS